MNPTARIYQFPDLSKGGRPRAQRSPLRSTAARKCRRPVSAKAQIWVWSTSARGTDQHVLLALTNRHNKDTGQCNPSMADLVADTGLGERTIRRSVSNLISAGIVEIENANEAGRPKGGRRVHTRYRFVVHAETRPDRPPFVNARVVVTGPCRPPSAPETRPDVGPSDPETRPNLLRNPANMATLSLRDEPGTEPGREANAAASPRTTDDTDGLFDEPSTPASLDRARVKIAQAIAARYCELEPMSKYVNVLGIVRRPLESDRFSGETVMAAVERIAKEQRTLTLETLRVELVGFTPRANGQQRDRRPLRERLKGGAA